MLTEEQFNRIDFKGRRGLYPLEVDALFDVFHEVEGFSAGCRSCPDTVNFALERLQRHIDEYKRHQEYKRLSEIMPSREEDFIIEKPEVKIPDDHEVRTITTVTNKALIKSQEQKDEQQIKEFENALKSRAAAKKRLKSKTNKK